MANFLFVYRGGEPNPKMTPEEMQQIMQKWGAWIGEAMQKGWMLDPGDALTKEGRVVNAKKVVTDGPFVESKEIVGGFAILRANSKAEAVQMAKDFLQFVGEGECEIRQIYEQGGPEPDCVKPASEVALKA